MKLWSLLLVCLLSGCVKISKNNSSTSDTAIKRHYYNSWEQEIGYTQAIKVGNRLLISGLTSQGSTMEEQVKGIYKRLEGILKDYDTDTGRIVKEVVYTKDIEALKKAISIRKQFYQEGEYPTSSWIQIDRLFVKEFKVEIEFEVAL